MIIEELDLKIREAEIKRSESGMNDIKSKSFLRGLYAAKLIVADYEPKFRKQSFISGVIVCGFLILILRSIS